MGISVNSVNSVLTNYTYNYASRLQPKLVKDDDGRWSKAEVQNYTSSYKKATGNTLDTDKLITTYDTDKDGYLGAKEQDAVNKADALGLSKLLQAKTTEAKAPAKEINLADLMATMSPAGKMSFSNAIQRSEASAKMIDNFMTSNANGSVTNLFSVLSQKNAAQMYRAQMQYGSSAGYSAMANQTMNLFI